MLLDKPGLVIQAMKDGQRLLGLDVGAKTIGMALSDPTLTIARPLDTIRRRKFSADVLILKDIVRTHEVGGIIIGLPRNMDGSEGPRCQSTRQFQRNIAEHIPLPMAFWDERLSTVAVTRTLLEADTSRARRAEVVDKLAASYILQGVLDRLKGAGS